MFIIGGDVTYFLTLIYNIDISELTGDLSYDAVAFPVIYQITLSMPAELCFSIYNQYSRDSTEEPEEGVESVACR